MNLVRKFRATLTALVLVLVLTVTTACSGTVQAKQPQLPPSAGYNQPGVGINQNYSQLERGNSAAGQNFGDWVVTTSQGLIKDAYVRDNDKLGVVISSDVRPNEVKNLAKSLLQGLGKNFPDKDLKVLVYAPDKQLILTADYDNSTKTVSYK